MAKYQFTPEILEGILTKITDKFSESLDKIMQEFRATNQNVVETQFTAINKRLDLIDAKLESASQDLAQRQPPQTLAISNNNQDTEVEIASRAFIEMEKQRDEHRIKSTNVIISGIAPNQEITDKRLLQDFCEANLTCIPNIVRTRRVGTEPNTKICATLESSESAKDLIESASLLRQSSNPAVKRVYFNRDLTRAEAEVAYRLRCQKRQERVTVNKNAASASGPDTSAPFRA